MFELIEVITRQVACDGGNGALGHPKVYLHIVHEEEDRVTCPYCSRTYQYKQPKLRASA